MAKKEAEQLIAATGADASTFEKTAQSMGLAVAESGSLLKNDPNHSSSFPQALVGDAFRLSRSTPVPSEPGIVDRSYYVYRFNDRQPPETAMSEEDRGRYKELLLQFKRQRILDAWLRNRQAKADIRIHKSLENY